jgi:thymidylate synthase
MNNIDRQYKELLDYLIHFGNKKGDRTGTGTISTFGWEIRHNMKEGFPLLTTKKVYFSGVVTELLWFLRGVTNIRYLLQNKCHIWTGDAYKNYRKNLESHYVKGGDVADEKQFEELILNDDGFASKYGELGPVYGKQWRNWGGNVEVKLTEERDENGWLKYKKIYHQGIDQIVNLIKDLKNNPDSRRLIVNAWNVDELPKMVLPPCHYGFQVYTRELSEEERSRIYTNKYGFDEAWKRYGHNIDFYDDVNIPKRAISLMWNQRSVDTFLGLPFNIASYGLLLEIIAKEVNMVPDELIGHLGDTHLYLNHIEQAKEQLTRTPFDLPKIKLPEVDSIIDNITEINPKDFILENYKSHATIKAPLSN